MSVKLVIMFAFIGILYCLGSGAFYLTKMGRGVSLAKTLTWRIVIALLLFCFLFFAYYAGWMKPHELTQPLAP